MLTTKNVGRFFAVIIVLGLTAGCNDDDDEKKTKYEISIYVSEHIKLDKDTIQVVTGGSFKKPKVLVQAPEGVDVRHDETKPHKGTLIEFAPLSLPLLLISLLATMSCIISNLCQHYTRLFPCSSPTYQRA